ncbi:hypothetical protein C8F04DRAFT_1270538 [Mycena alexandri]|uniref:Uncharacterized protein n=1 Tax=Mycena alexandri TaxID=1745969 RepID=A0AAD6SBK7_9AGAR|nr:hypothetical protein C8F04DRAFT_1270538 [Mycena alexandri]
MNGKKERDNELNDTMDSKKEPDDWAEALGAFMDMYFKTPAPDMLRCPMHDDLIPPGEPRSWDDHSWQTGEPKCRPRPKPFLKYVPLGIQHYNGERAETKWASLAYMHEVMAEHKGRPTAMHETHEYHDYLRNKHHMFAPEERECNDEIWARRRQARLKKYRRAELNRKALAATAAGESLGFATQTDQGIR